MSSTLLRLLIVPFIIICTGSAQPLSPLPPSSDSYIWIKVYGDAGAKSIMQFGNTFANTRGIDTAASLLTWKETEAPPAGPGFDAIWGGITPSQFPGMRGLLGKDFRSLAGAPTRVDTFDIKFNQADNSAVTISFKWACVGYLADRVDSMKMTVIDPTHGNYVIDMMATDTLTIPAAGDDGIAKVQIIKYGAFIPPFYYTCSPVAVEQEETLPHASMLFQNYPNPFNPVTHFVFRVSKFGFVSLKVFDILGREVATLVHEDREPGEYSLDWDAATQPSGVYYYRLRVNNHTEIKKMVLTK